MRERRAAPSHERRALGSRRSVLRVRGSLSVLHLVLLIAARSVGRCTRTVRRRAAPIRAVPLRTFERPIRRRRHFADSSRGYGVPGCGGRCTCDAVERAQLRPERLGGRRSADARRVRGSASVRDRVAGRRTSPRCDGRMAYARCGSHVRPVGAPLAHDDPLSGGVDWHPRLHRWPVGRSLCRDAGPENARGARLCNGPGVQRSSRRRRDARGDRRGVSPILSYVVFGALRSRRDGRRLFGGVRHRHDSRPLAAVRRRCEPPWSRPLLADRRGPMGIRPLPLGRSADSRTRFVAHDRPPVRGRAVDGAPTRRRGRFGDCGDVDVDCGYTAGRGRRRERRDCRRSVLRSRPPRAPRKCAGVVPWTRARGGMRRRLRRHRHADEADAVRQRRPTRRFHRSFVLVP